MPIPKKLAVVFLIGALGVIILALLASPTAAQEKVCTLSDDSFEKAKAIFARMASVFRNPRCVNCHGGVNPFTPNTQHAGGAYDKSLDKEGFPTSEMFGQCQTCHGDFPGWAIPTSDMWFAGKDDVELCKLLKRQFGNGETLIRHLTNDLGGTPFIEVGFKGTRGLNEMGRDMVDHYRPEPIQGVTQAQLVQMGSDWVDALGSRSDPIGGDSDSDCGCVQHHYAFESHSDSTINYGPLHWAATGSAPLIRLVFEKGGGFHSDKATLTASGSGTAGPCSMQGGGQTALSVKGKTVGETDKKLQITATSEGGQGTGSAECPHASDSMTMPFQQSSSISFELDAIVGARHDFPTMQGVPGGGGSAWVKLIKID